MKKVLLAVASMLLLTAGMAAAEEASSLQIGGDYRFTYEYLKGNVHDYTQLVPSSLAGGAPAAMPVQGYSVKNTALMTNRFGLNLKANPLEDLNVKARMVMNKVWGHETSSPVDGSFFADRAFGPNDGTIGHIPQDNTLRVDYAYATVSNLFNAPVWFSIGRRPSTGGVPSNYRQNEEKTGTGGIPSIMVNYAFDGYTIGFAPDIDALPGAYAKFCAGKGFDSGYRGGPFDSGLKDTDFYGLNVVPFDTDNLHIELQYQIGKHIFDRPSDNGVENNLGDMSWYGGVATTKLGNLNFFFSGAVSQTDPTGAISSYDLDRDGITDAAGGMLFNPGEQAEKKSGFAVYVGARYDIATTKTKIGLEYNKGSKNWIGMVPAEDDTWTGKLGTRGNVYEVYIIQELDRKQITKNGSAFVKIGYQRYDFEYTGSNFWIGSPAKISGLQATGNLNQANMFAAVEKASDLYATFNVRF